MGFPVILATEGQKGVEKAIEENPYLILMDILMAGMDGREVTRMIRSIPETQDIPVLAATLLLKHLDRKAALKPDALITLLSQLASWRRKRRFRPLFLVQVQISYNRRWHREIFCSAISLPLYSIIHLALRSCTALQFATSRRASIWGVVDLFSRDQGDAGLGQPLLH